jgi:hypothetical protein
MLGSGAIVPSDHSPYQNSEAIDALRILKNTQSKKSKCDGLQNLELHCAPGIHHCCAASVSVVRLSRCSWTG